MNFFKISIAALISQVIFVIPALTATNAKNCKYVSQSILVVGSASSDASCVPNLLCVANVSCEDGFGKKEKSIACTAAEGKCPDLEKCVADRTTYYKEEVKIGEAGKKVWTAYAIATAPNLISAYMNNQMEKSEKASKEDYPKDSKGNK
ncbi:MAG: hypothetical protein V4596_13080 [Bdellovibrionota bacterium]